MVFIDLYWNCEKESHRLLAPSFGAFRPMATCSRIVSNKAQANPKRRKLTMVFSSVFHGAAFYFFLNQILRVFVDDLLSDTLVGMKC